MLALVVPFAGAISVLLTILHIVICVFLIFVVLLQRGRSQDLASAFGGGQTQANLAAMSTDDFLTRATKISAFLFMGTSLALALFAQGRAKSVLDIVPGQDKPTAEDGATPGATGASGPEAATTPDVIVPPADTVPIEVTPTEPVPTEPVPTEPTPGG